MSIATLILGESGTGKSSSMRNFSPDEVLLIQSIRKPLPFRSPGWKSVTPEGGNIIVTDNADKIMDCCRRTRRKIIVIDDFQYVLANEFMRRTDERGYDKFTEIGKHAWQVFTGISDLAADVRVYVMSHTQDDDHGKTKIKTIGRMLDEKITPEGMFSIVLRTTVIDREYLFSTQNNGSDTVKSPLGMFAEERIPNDLSAVDSAICDYYGIAAEA